MSEYASQDSFPLIIVWRFPRSDSFLKVDMFFSRPRAFLKSNYENMVIFGSAITKVFGFLSLLTNRITLFSFSGYLHNICRIWPRQVKIFLVALFCSDSKLFEFITSQMKSLSPFWFLKVLFVEPIGWYDLNFMIQKVVQKPLSKFGSAQIFLIIDSLHRNQNYGISVL